MPSGLPTLDDRRFVVFDQPRRPVVETKILNFFFHNPHAEFTLDYIAKYIDVDKSFTEVKLSHLLRDDKIKRRFSFTQFKTVWSAKNA